MIFLTGRVKNKNKNKKITGEEIKKTKQQKNKNKNKTTAGLKQSLPPDSARTFPCKWTTSCHVYTYLKAINQDNKLLNIKVFHHPT